MGENMQIPINAARQKLAELLGRNCGLDRLRVEGDFRGADLSNFRINRWPDKVELAGDFSGAKFVNTHLPHIPFHHPTDLELELRPFVLSGNFAGADFAGAVLSHFQLKGDFTGTNFRRATLDRCQLAGRFDGADLGASFLNCETLAGATFVGAELGTAVGLECTAQQAATAVLGSNPQVLITNGQFMTVGRVEFPLMELATVPDGPSDRKIRFEVLGVQTSNVIRTERIVEISDATIEVIGSPPQDPFKAKLSLGLKTTDVTLTGIQVDELTLAGSYVRVAIVDSPQIKSLLLLQGGNFQELDLSQTKVASIEIELRSSSIEKITLPSCVRAVSVAAGEVGQTNLGQPNVVLEKLSLREIELALNAWSSPAQRLPIARMLLTTVPRMSRQRMQRILNSQETQMLKVLGRKSAIHGAAAMAGLLIAHENCERKQAVALRPSDLPAPGCT